MLSDTIRTVKDAEEKAAARVAEARQAAKADIAAAWGSVGDKLTIRLRFVSTPHGFDLEFCRKEGRLFICKSIDKGAKSLGLALN